MNIAQALKSGASLLSDSESPEVDSQVLLSHIMNQSSTYLRMWPEKSLSALQQTLFHDYIAQRQTGMPVAYIIGQRGFWTLDLKVTDATLIPRPDTELLVSLALEKYQPNMRIADLGTGSGAIALAVASECPKAQVYAMDYSAEAIVVADENAKRNQLNNVHFWQGSWLQAIKAKQFDLIISNPPYIESEDPHLSVGDVRFEPITALASGRDGLEDIRQITEQSVKCLRAGGWLMLEHGYHQSQQVQQILHDAGFQQISAFKDYGDNDRVVIGQLAL